MAASQGAAVAHVTYNAGFIVLSYIVSLVGACTALELLHRRTSRKGLYNWYLLLGSSVSMGGIGIWCMHFIGNRAIDLSGPDVFTQIVYSSGFTAVSFFLPIAVLSGAFYLLGVVEKAGYLYISFSGVLTGLAVCGMHYVGQLGIANYRCHYKVAYVAGAAIIAIFASLVALTVFFRMRANWSNNWWKRVLCGGILASAVSGMHWVATVGTIYQARPIYDSSTSQLSPTQTVIVCTVLSCASCVLLLVIAFLTSRSERQWRSRAQQMVLACAYFDENGRLMVTTEGQVPSTKITDHYIERSFRDDDFGRTHPAFLWIFRATRNWITLRDMIPGMKEHLQLNLINSDLFKPSSGRATPSDQSSGFSEDFDKLFKEMFCISAQDLATQTHQSLEKLGILYEEPLETGTQSSKRLKRVSLTNKPTPDLEGGISSRYFGRGHFLFVVRDLSNADVERFAASGYRFASVPQVVDVQARSMQVDARELEERLRSMHEYATSEHLMEQGVHLAAFVLRPNVRNGFEVLVTKEQSNQLPLKTLPIAALTQWHVEIINQMDSLTVASALKWLKAIIARNEKESAFCQQLYQTMSDLVEFVNDPSIHQAKFSAKRIQAPCRPAANATSPGRCTILSIRLISNLHSSTPNDKLIYKPLRLFNTQQQVYAGLSDHEAFARQIHLEFYSCSANRDMVSEMSRRSSRFKGSSPARLWRKRQDSTSNVPIAEIPLVAHAAFGGITVTNQVSVEMSEFGKVDSADTADMAELGTHGDAVFAAADPDTYVDEIYALFK